MGNGSSVWNAYEIQAAVAAYLSMLQREQNGERLNKAHENRALRAGALASRTESSVEFRMQNISAVLEKMGHAWIVGYRPAKNVGANVEKSIRNALDILSPVAPEDFEPTADEATLEKRAAKLEKQVLKGPPKGIIKPQQSPSTGKSFFRDPAVRAWVRKLAAGVCEACNHPAPFEMDGQPFLEVHHVKHLSQEGSDTYTNAVAICPNCHRRCHHSADRHEFTASLYAKVERLIPE